MEDRYSTVSYMSKDEFRADVVLSYVELSSARDIGNDGSLSEPLVRATAFIVIESTVKAFSLTQVERMAIDDRKNDGALL